MKKARLKNAPFGFGLVDLLVEEGEEVGLGDAFLGHRVAFAEGEGVAGLFDGVEVDGHAPRGADLILAAVAFADGAGLVVEDGVAALEFFVEGLGALGERFLVFEKREHGDFDGSDAGAEAEDDAFFDITLFVGDVFFGVSGAQGREEDTVGADGGLDDVRDEFFLGGFVEDFLRLAGGVGVLGEVVAAAGGDAPEFLHAEGVAEHDVGRAAGIER